MALPTQWARVKFNFTSTEGTWENVLWFNLIGAFSGSFDIAAAATSLDSTFSPLFVAFMQSSNKYVGVDLTVNNAGVVSTSSSYPSNAGSGVGNPVPVEVAAIVKLQTAIAGKSGRGRMFVAGLDGNNCDVGRLTSGGRTLVQNLATQLKTPLTIQAQSWHPAVHSKVLDNLNDVVTGTAELLLGTQRRRRPKR